MMGDEADYILDHLLYGDDERDFENYPPREVRCRHCGSEDVYWAKDGTGRWALYNLNSRKHVCNDRVVSAVRLDAFDDLDE